MKSRILTEAHSYATEARAEQEVLKAIEVLGHARYVILSNDGRFTAAVVTPDDFNTWVHATIAKHIAVIG